MLRDMASLSRTMPKWSIYERGIESLVNSLIPSNSEDKASKKGRTLDDLMIKVVWKIVFT